MASPQGPSGPDRRKLIEAYQDLVRSEQEKRHTQPQPERKPPRHRFAAPMGLLAVMLAAVLLLEPRWLFTPPLPPEPPALQEASLRLAMFRSIELIDAFREVNGRFPHTLAEAGADSTALTFALTPDGYTLTGTNGRVTLTYTFPADPRQFLGKAYEVIRQRNKL